jgi:YD repeat-containing protein
MKHAPQFIIAMQRALPMYFSSLLFLLVATQAMSQFDYNKVISPSPTASALGKYGDVPVSLYTGTPNISIPLGALTGTELELPVSLSYMARGVKVEENASWVGTGWSLNAGGVITCTIRGREDADGKPRPTFPMPLSAADKSSILTDIQHNVYDPEPDLFFFNLPGHSGSFVLDATGKAVLDDSKDIRIVRDAVNKYKFTITIENGTQYIFDKIETTSYQGSSSAGGVAGIYLSKIVSATGKEVVNFTYAEELTKFYSLSRPVKRIRPGNVAFDAYPATFGITTINSLRLTDITTNFGGNLRFIPDSLSRKDLGLVSMSVAPHALKAIQFYDGNGVVKKSIDFTYDMIGTWKPYSQLRGTDPPADQNTEYSNYRLYLASVKEISGAGRIANPPYVFKYFGRTAVNLDLLPNKLSPSQDHWGYYNAAPNQDLWPGYSGPFGTFDSNFNAKVTEGCAPTVGGQASFTMQGADRRPRFPVSQFGILTDITYPTGAQTNFTFEQHRYAYESSKGGYVTTESEAIAQLFVAGGSSILTDQAIVNASLAATITVEFAATCWDSNTNSRPFDCTAPNAQTDFDLFQENSVALIDASGHEVAALKWIPGDRGFHVYRDGIIYGPAIMPDAEGNIKADITDLNLPYGSYTFTLNKDRDSPTDIFAWFHYPSETSIDISNPAEYKTAGGLRIKKIETFDENGRVAGVKTYKYGLGVLIDGPKYSTYVFSQGSFLQPCEIYPSDGTMVYLEVSSGSYTSLGQTQGAPIGYQSVTEEYNGNGSIIYEYTTGIEYPDNSETESNDITYVFTNTTGTVFQETYSFPGRAAWPHINQDNADRKRGFLKKTTYKEVAGQEVMIKENIPIIKDRNAVYGLRLQTLRPNIDWLYSIYKYSSGTVNIARNIETQIQQTPFNKFNKIVDFFYDSPYHGQVTKQTTTGSRGEIETTEFHYPDDYAAINDLNHPVAQMKSANLHMIGSPVETRKYQNGIITGGSINVPAIVNGQREFFVAPKTAFVMKEQISNPATPWSLDPANPDLDIFNRDIELTYDAQANLVLAKPRDQLPIAFLWEPGTPSPVAKIVDGTSGSAYYSGFELSGRSEISTDAAHTGNKCWGYGNYDFANDGNFSPLHADALLMSYWYWNEDRWIFSGDLPFASLISSPGTRLDDIRAFPRGSQMTTYTYELLVGVTSQTDPNNVTTYFQYDDLGRLELILDNNGDILKKYTYHLSGQ